ncbi:DinB family protein [Paenibacillus caui]|uniref:DinB family protein n=1 Tax=Paenibacillus caui TaxID=2873927 RepID=UPI001CA81D18|nr:DinB family protein [Paenibacillus caui]
MSDVNIGAFLDTYEQLLAAAAGLDEEQLSWKQAPEVWSVKEVLSHLVDHSIVVSFRIRDILAETTVRLPAFNQDAWVSGQHANDGDAASLLDTFYALLLNNARLFRRLSAAEWEKTGVNAKGETVSVADIAGLFIRHVQTHLGQIERIKQAAAAASV